jgi:hypothetical protein
MFAYDIVGLTYDIVYLFSGQHPAVPITLGLGPPPMLRAYRLNLLNGLRIL